MKAHYFLELLKLEKARYLFSPDFPKYGHILVFQIKISGTVFIDIRRIFLYKNKFFHQNLGIKY